MPDTIQTSTARTAAELAEIVEQPFPELQELQDALNASRGVLPAPALREALHGLEIAEERLKASRLRAYANELAKALRPHGLILEAKVAKRAPAKRRKKPDGGGDASAHQTQSSGPKATTSTPAPAPDTAANEPPRERRGFLGGRKAQ